jgi:hypothetical protein
MLKKYLFLSLASLSLALFMNTVQAFSCADTATTGIPQIECEALVALYDSTNGGNWESNNDWKTATPVDDWTGIRVRNGNVFTVSLIQNGLTGSIPPELGNLSHLNFLYLNNNQLTGSIPPELGNLSDLEYLYLDNNQLTGSIPEELGNLHSLKAYSLANNQLTEEIIIINGVTETSASCTENDCTYQLSIIDTGFFVMTIELPETGQEGFWGLSINAASGVNHGGFNAGAILKENGDVPGFIGFYLSESESVSLTPYEYLGVTESVVLRLITDDTVIYENTVKSGTRVTTDKLEPGFYIAEILSQAGTVRGLSGLNVNASSLIGGVNVGGWIDRKTSGSSAGFGTFYIPWFFTLLQQFNIKLLFGENYGDVGASQLNAKLYLQQADGSRQLKWSSN